MPPRSPWQPSPRSLAWSSAGSSSPDPQTTTSPGNLTDDTITATLRYQLPGYWRVWYGTGDARTAGDNQPGEMPCSRLPVAVPQRVWHSRCGEETDLRIVTEWALGTPLTPNRLGDRRHEGLFLSSVPAVVSLPSRTQAWRRPQRKAAAPQLIRKAAAKRRLPLRQPIYDLPGARGGRDGRVW